MCSALITLTGARLAINAAFGEGGDMIRKYLAAIAAAAVVIAATLALVYSSSPRAEPHATALQRELRASRDLRAFAFSAMQRPQEGGYFYAR